MYVGSSNMGLPGQRIDNAQLISDRRQKFFTFMRNKEVRPMQNVSDEYKKYSTFIGSAGVSFGTGSFAGTAWHTKVIKYREMYDYPEVRYATNLLASKVKDIGLFVHLKSDEFKQASEYAFTLLQDLIDEISHEMLLTFIIDGKLFLRKVLSDSGTSIDRIQILDSTKVKIVFDKFNEIDYYDYNSHKCMPSEIIYINWGQFGLNPNDVRAYYDPAMKVYEQLRSIEDTLVNLRQMRTRAWFMWKFKIVDTDQATAENNIQQFLADMRHKNQYNAQSGGISQSPDNPDVIRHVGFWEDAAGHSVSCEKFSFDLDLGSMEDLKFLQDKLWSALQVPMVYRPTEGEGRAYTAVAEIKTEEKVYLDFATQVARRYCSGLNQLLYNLILLNYKMPVPMTLKPRIVEVFPKELMIIDTTLNQKFDLNVKENSKDIVKNKLEFKEAMKKLIVEAVVGGKEAETEDEGEEPAF